MKLLALALLLQGSGLLPYVILAGTTTSPHSCSLKAQYFSPKVSFVGIEKRHPT